MNIYKIDFFKFGIELVFSFLTIFFVVWGFIGVFGSPAQNRG